MGVTYTIDDDVPDGGIRRRVTLTAQFDTDYTTGGEPLDPADAGLDSIEAVSLQENVTESGYVASYRAGDGTIKLYETGGAGATLAEVADATDVSTESATVLIFGRS